ncbi:MAG: hypothetical protein ACXADY_15090 [Candidatus Hodarchaeales archaeon]
MGKRRKYECDICGKRVPEECLEHLRIFHPEEYSFRKMEFVETAVIIGLEAVAANKTIKKMSGEDLEKAYSKVKLKKKIPKSYDNIIDFFRRNRAKKWYMQKILLDERAKSIIRIVTKRLGKDVNIDITKKIAINLVERYTKKRIRSCYDERVIALSALLAACKFTNNDIEQSRINELILEREVDPKEFFKIFNWMEKQLMPDHEYIKQLLGSKNKSVNHLVKTCTFNTSKETVKREILEDKGENELIQNENRHCLKYKGDSKVKKDQNKKNSIPTQETVSSESVFQSKMKQKKLDDFI